MTSLTHCPRSAIGLAQATFAPIAGPNFAAVRLTDSRAASVP